MTWTDVDLSTVDLFYGSVYSGGHVSYPSNGTGDFMIPGLVLDPTKFYVFKVTYSTDAAFQESSFRGLYLYSVPSEGVNAGDPDWSSLWEFHMERWYANTTDATSTILVGPGRRQWDNAASSVPPEMQVLFEFSVGAADSTGGHAWVSAVSYREAPESGWLDADPVWVSRGYVHSNDTRDWSTSYDILATGLWNDRITKAWNNDWFERFSGSSASYGYGIGSDGWVTADGSGNTATFSATWATLIGGDPGVVTSGVLPPGIVDGSGNFIDPNVVGIEWEPTSVYTDQRLWVRLLGFDDVVGDQSIPSGGYTAVKLVQEDPTVRYDPGFQTAGSIASFGTIATIPWDEDETYIPLDHERTGVVLTVMDGNSATQTIPTPSSAGFSAGGRFEVSLQSLYPIRYRLIYVDDPVPPTPSVVATGLRAPSLRMLQRGGAGGMSGIPRMIGDPTRRGSVRQGPGSVI